MDTVIKIVKTLEELDSDYEKVKGFWDDLGFAFYISVKKNGSIGLCSKHWAEVVYLQTVNCTTDQLWRLVADTMNAASRTMVQAENGNYVFVSNLNEEQTDKMFNLLKKHLQTANIEFDKVLKLEFQWETQDAVLPENKQ